MGGADQGEWGERGMRAVSTATQALVAGAVLLAASSVSAAPTFTNNDILGKWCGSDTNYVIGVRVLRVTWKAKKTTGRYLVNHFGFTDTGVTMYWRRGRYERLLSTQFTEFSRDRRTMVQVANDAGPRRAFRRC